MKGQRDCVLNDLEELVDQDFLVLIDHHNIKKNFLWPPPPAIVLFHISSEQCREFSSTEDNLLISRIQSLHLLVEVNCHDEEEYSVVLTLGKRYANKFLALHQSKIFHR